MLRRSKVAQYTQGLILVVFTGLLFISYTSTVRAEGCGEIIIPAGFYYESFEEVRSPIEDCDNPFNTDTVVDFTATLKIDDQLVSEGSVISLLSTATTTKLQLEMDRESFSSPLDLYRKEEAGYTLKYHIGTHVVSAPKLEAGIYTAVFVYSEPPMLNRVAPSWWQKIRDVFITTAYANYPSYDQVLAVNFEVVYTEPEPKGASSVLFLPGIQASRLYKDWGLGLKDELWIPDGNQDVADLAMDSSGNSMVNVYTKDILPSIPIVGPTVYADFTSFMNRLASSSVIDSWTPFAYDWRYSVEDISNNGTKYEDEIKNAITEIERLATDSFSEKVTIIGHSNGGLLAKAILRKMELDGKKELVDKVILLASPQLGTPKAIGTILHGYDQEKMRGWLIDDVVARQVIRNMPGAYGLVTSEKYLNTTSDKVIRFDNSTSTESFRNSYGSTIDSIEELKQFMTGATDNRSEAVTVDEVINANNEILTNELALHKYNLDDWTAPEGVKVVEIVGTGLDTVSGFEYRTFTKRFCQNLGACETRYIYKPVPIISQQGDKTVMSLSAEAYEGDKEQYFIDLNAVEDNGGNAEHFNITENPSIQTLIKNILTEAASDIEFITRTPSTNNEERIMFGGHSPVDIEVTDTNGNRVGKTVVNGNVTKEESIPGSSYFEIGTSKYIIVPRDSSYEIKITGTGNGSLTLTQDNLIGNNQVSEYSVAVATITASTTVTASFDDDLSNLEIDTNGDGNLDQVLTPQGLDVTPKITYKDLKNKINSLSLSKVRKLPLQILVDAAEQLDNKSVTKPHLTQLETLALKHLESLLVMYQKKKWISQSDIDVINFIINKLK